MRLGGSAGGFGGDVGGTLTLLEGSVLTLFWRKEAEDAGMVEEPESGAEFLDFCGMGDSSQEIAERSGTIRCPEEFQHVGRKLEGELGEDALKLHIHRENAIVGFGLERDFVAGPKANSGSPFSKPEGILPRRLLIGSHAKEQMPLYGSGDAIQ